MNSTNVTYRPLGEFIRLVDERNKDLKVKNLQGLSIEKKFIPSIANTIGTDMSTYRVVKPRQFAYGPVTSRNGDQVTVALYKGEESAIISQAYLVFEITDFNQLLPEYLMMWFLRPEFDRYARFHSHGSAREIFDWDELCATQIPVPPIEEQHHIVEQYNAVQRRIEIQTKLITKLQDTAQTLYKKTFVDDIDKDHLPDGWRMGTLGEVTVIVDNRGKTPPVENVKTDFPLIEIASIRTMDYLIDYEKCEKWVSKYTYDNWFRSGHPHKKDILISTVGSLAEMKVFWDNKGCVAQNVVAFRCKEISFALFLYQYMLSHKKELLSYEIGSVQASIKVSQLVEYRIVIPSNDKLKEFDCSVTPLYDAMALAKRNVLKLKEIQIIILSKIGK